MEKTGQKPITVADVIQNMTGTYEGNLVPYFRAVFHQAKNIGHPYHNLRHMLHVLWQCHDACLFYNFDLSMTQKRVLLIAAIFHDFDHSGFAGDDDVNIERALRAVRRHLLPIDEPHLGTIEMLISETEYPYRVPNSELTQCAQILRDADMSQTVSETWIQQIIVGFASEWRKSPYEVLVMQETFVKNLRFHTEWAQERYPQTVIDARLREVQSMLRMLTPVPA